MKKKTATGFFGSTLFAAVLATAGIDRSGIAVGTLTMDEAATVNGIDYDIAGAVITADGTESDSSILQDGQIVTVRGFVDSGAGSGIALEVVYDDNVDGPVEEIDPWDEYGSLTVLGQGVRITPETRFDPAIVPASAFGLHSGMHLEVSGLPGENDEVNATWIGLQPAGSGYEVTGYAKNVDTDKRELTINDLVVDYRTADVSGFLDGYPVDYDRVEVRGVQIQNDGRLRATLVERNPVVLGRPGTDVTVDAIITMFDSLEYFELDGIAASIDEATNFNGGDAGQVDTGVRLRIDGHVDEYGMLVAETVEFP